MAQTHEQHPLTLCEADAAALDAFVEENARGKVTTAALIDAEVKAADPARVTRLRRELAPLGLSPSPEVPGDLLAKTLAAVQADTMRITPERVADQAEEKRVLRHRLFRRLSEIGAAAIAASILVAVLIPGISAMRASHQRTLCASNLGNLSNAFAMYATNFSGQLPQLAMPTDGNWLPRDVSTATPASHSNTANLLPLVRSGVAQPESMLCAGRQVANASFDITKDEIPDDLRGYSYINLIAAPATRPTFDGKHETIVLADRNPLFVDSLCNPQVASFNHRNGLYVLRADKSITWETNPNLGPKGDNIWTIRLGEQDARTYRGNETIRLAGDVFLSP